MSMWGGRFGEGMSDETWDFTVDDSDRRMLLDDVEGSMAHVEMLGATGILDPGQVSIIVGGLETIADEAVQGIFRYSEIDEDVHSAVERRLYELIGEPAGRLHTGRSRNDQVATDLRLYLRRAGEARLDEIDSLVSTIVDIAEREAATPVPSYTHLQQAQTTTLGNHLLAYAWMLLRDRERLTGCIGRVDASPLGAGAGAGSGLPLDRQNVADSLGFASLIENTLDAVGSRDFVAEYVSCCAQTMTHLSRLAEEVLLWTTAEFGWATPSDEVSTGSSALPQKRNVDIAELIRGRTAGVIGNLTAVMTLQKGLPLAYNRDLQEDKRIVFHADDTVSGSLGAMQALLVGLTFHPPDPRPETAALDLAERLVGRGVPFREAHEAAGGVVRALEEQGKSFADLTAADLLAVSDRFEADDVGVVSGPMGPVRDRVAGETAVKTQVEKLRTLLTRRG